MFVRNVGVAPYPHRDTPVLRCTAIGERKVVDLCGRSALSPPLKSIPPSVEVSGGEERRGGEGERGERRRGTEMPRKMPLYHFSSLSLLPKPRKSLHIILDCLGT